LIEPICDAKRSQNFTVDTITMLIDIIDEAKR
jgi:hypothetical protein